MRFAGAAVVDPARSLFPPEPKVHLHHVLDVDEIPPLLARAVLSIAAEEMRFAGFLNLIVELIEDRRHLPLVLFLRTIDVEVAKPHHLTARLGKDLADVAVKRQLRKRVGIEGVLTFVPFAKAV